MNYQYIYVLTPKHFVTQAHPRANRQNKHLTALTVQTSLFSWASQQKPMNANREGPGSGQAHLEFFQRRLEHLQGVVVMGNEQQLWS
jgi:hypothetical protein